MCMEEVPVSGTVPVVPSTVPMTAEALIVKLKQEIDLLKAKAYEELTAMAKQIVARDVEIDRLKRLLGRKAKQEYRKSIEKYRLPEAGTLVVGRMPDGSIRHTP